MKLQNKLLSLAPTLSGPYSADVFSGHPELAELKKALFEYCVSFIIEKMGEHADVFESANELLSFYDVMVSSDHVAPQHFIRSSLGHPFKRLMQSHGQERIAAIIELSVQMAFCAKSPAWEFTLEKPSDFLLMGVLYRDVKHVRCVQDEAGATLRVFFDGSEHVYVYDDVFDAWMPEHSESFVLLCGKKIYVIPVDEGNAEYYLEPEETPFASNHQFMIRDLQRAADYIEKHSPLYAKWVANTLKEILVIDRIKGMTTNRSSSHIPCSIVMSYPPAEADDFPQIFVHETTHTYLHLLSSIESLVNGLDTSEYYSPIKKTTRPLEAILTTYHAFANVILFLRDCNLHGAENKDYNDREDRYYQDVITPLIPALSSTNGLTDIGHCFWRPLAKQLGHI